MTKNQIVSLVELQRLCVKIGEMCRRSAITATLHQSGPHGRVARQMPLRLEFTKEHLNGSQTPRNKILCSHEMKIELFVLTSKRSMSGGK